MEHIQITNTFVISSSTGVNSSPIFQNYPVYFGKNGNQAFYDPNFIDPNGDSLSYSITNCDASNYYLPGGVTLSPYGVLSFCKDSIGLYAFAYNITEWRKDIDGNYLIVGVSQVDFVMDINSSIGINEINSYKELKTYPNPASNTLHIKSEQYFEPGTSIEITNTLGQTVLKLPYTNEIDVSGISNGCYFLKITTAGNRTYHTKFVKQ